MALKKKDVLKLVISLALAGLLLWLAFRSVDWKAFVDGLSVTRWVYLIPFVVASVGALVFRAFRWQLLIRSTGIRPGWLTVWDANNVGNLANIALPGTGEFIRCGYVAGKEGYGNVLGTILMERIWDFLAIMVMIVLALVLDQGKFGPFFAEHVWAPLAGKAGFSLWWVVLLVVALIALFFWAVFHYRSRFRFFGKVADALSSVGRGFAAFLRMERKGLFLDEFGQTMGRQDVHAVYIPECAIDFKAEAARLSKVMDKYDAVNVFVSEGAGVKDIMREMRRRGEEVPVDAFGHPRLDKVNVGQYVGKRLGELLGAEKVQVFKSGYFARSAAPNRKDLRLIEKCARKAVECALGGVSGVVGPDENNHAQIGACAFSRIKGGKIFNVRKGSFRTLVKDIGQPKLRKKRANPVA